jgi:DNA polymerase-1
MEADDLLGSLAETEIEAGGQALLLTGDRDMYQCVGDRVSVLYLKSGTSGVEEVDPDEVHKRYGIPPALVPDFIALRGDPSDSLPGAAGVGPKTAAELLTRHGSLEEVIAAASEQRPRIAQALTEQSEELLAFRKIAQLQTVPVRRPADRPTDLEGGARAARELGLNRLAQRLEEATDISDL